MHTAPYDDQPILFSWTPVVCTACRETLCDLHDPGLAEAMAAHQCGDPGRFTR